MLPPRPAPQTASHLETTVLENGLTVFIQEMHTAPIVSVWCWYKVGSKDERPGQTGISHWVEHMNFRGTVNIPRDQVKGIVEQFGGSWNGYTWIDQTGYVETAAREALDRMLFIEAERMANCLYEPADCEAERTVIISELQGGDNDPEQLLDTEVTAAAFKAHTYRHPTIGWLGDLQAMSREDLYQHYRRHYLPNNAALVIVGDVEAEDALRQVRRYFAKLPPGPLPARSYTVEPPQLGERRVRLEREGTTAYLKLAYHAPAATDPDFFSLLILDAVLTGAKGVNLWASFRNPPQRSARLYRALVDRGLASGVFGTLLPTEHPFLYTIAVTASDGVALELVEEAALADVALVAREGITTAELEKARRQLRARLVFESDSVTSIAHQLGYFHTIGALEPYFRLPEALDAVTIEDVARVAAERLAPANRTVGWFEPIAAEHTGVAVAPRASDVAANRPRGFREGA